MNIAYITVLDLKSQVSGVIKQAKTWREMLSAGGVNVEYINPWHSYEWKDFDALHVFGGGFWMPQFLENTRREGLAVVHSPMIDTSKNRILYRIVSLIPHFGHKLYTNPSVHKINNTNCTLCLARSADEKRILNRGLGVPIDRINVVPICIETKISDSVPVGLDREFLESGFCLHVSQYTQKRKNLVRLAEACGRLKLPLVVCGRPESAVEGEAIERAVSRLTRSRFLNYVSKGELVWLFRNCNVFALPSLYEGVGLAALEAAYYGAEVVVSTVGGAPDYFDGIGHFADPYSVSSISEALEGARIRPLQPAASRRVRDSYSEAATLGALLHAYQNAKILCAGRK